MNRMSDTRATTYLASLRRELADLSEPAASSIVDGIEAHIADALDEGRPLEEVLERLGRPDDVARISRVELGASPEPVRSSKAGTLAAITAIAVAVVTAVFVSFFADSLFGARTSLAVEYGAAAALLTLLPAIIAATPLLVPACLRGYAAVAAAVIVSGGCMAFFSVGIFFVPVAIILIAAAVVQGGPYSPRVRRAARLTFGIIVGAPALPFVGLAASGAVELNVAVIVAISVCLALGVGFMSGRRVAYVALSIVGAAVMLLALIDGGLLMMLFWWVGGLWLALGTASLSVARRQ